MNSLIDKIAKPRAAIRTLHRLMTNLTYVKVDRMEARAHWNLMARAVTGPHFPGNEKVIVENKAVAGILGHIQTRGFVIHRMKERRILRHLKEAS